MKKLKLILLLLTLTVSVVPAVAEQGSSQGGNRPPIVLTRANGQGHIKTPKAPDRQVITCYYDGEILTLNFVYSEGLGILSIKDGESHEYIYNVDTSALFIQFPAGSLIGRIEIQLVTENGKSFEGFID